MQTNTLNESRQLWMVALFWGMLTASLLSEDGTSWMQFRGPLGAGRSETKMPHTAVTDLNGQVLWKIETMLGHSSPIVVNDSIFFTGYEDGLLSTLCLSLKDGQLLWKKDIPVQSLEKTHPQHGPSTPTPVSDGKSIFVVFGSLGIIAYELDGTERWRRPLVQQKNMFGSGSSPVIIDQKLVVMAGTENESLLQAIDPKDGGLIWERRRPGPASTWSTPTPWSQGKRRLVLFYEPFHLRASYMEDGSDAWSLPGMADEPVTIPQTSKNRIVITSYNLRTNREAIGLPTFETLLKECDSDHDGAISTVEAKTNKTILSRPDADGQGDHPLRMFIRLLDEDRDGFIRADEWPRIHRWIDPWDHANGIIAIGLDSALEPTEDVQVPSMAWQFSENIPECPTPVCWGDRIYFVRNGGMVSCLNLETGEKAYSERLAGGGPYYASPIAVDGKIYIASARGQLSVIEASERPKLLSKVDFGEPIWATPAIVNQKLVVRTEKSVWAIDLRPKE